MAPLLLGDRLLLVGVEETLVAALLPVLVAGVEVEDVLVEDVSGCGNDLGGLRFCVELLVTRVELISRRERTYRQRRR